MQTQKAPVKTYYKNKKVYGTTRPYYQIYLGVNTPFIEQEVIIISEDDFNNLSNKQKELNKLQTEHNIISSRFEKVSNDNTELNNINAELKQQIKTNKEKLKEFEDLKKENKELKEINKELAAEIIKTNKINKSLYNGLINIVNQNPINRLLKRIPQDVQDIIKDNKIKALLKDKE